MNLDELAIISECYADTCLIETIISIQHCNHQKSCNKVSSTMQIKFKDRFAVGIIDKDKRQISYLNEFDLIGSKASLFFYKHTMHPHYIIQLSPAVEGFILESAREKNIKLSDYGFPETLGELTRITKQKSSKKDPDLKKLITDLKDATGIKLLTDLLEYLVPHRYDCDISVLRSMMS